MKHVVATLEGALLDAAVAKGYGLPFLRGRVHGDAFDAWELALERPEPLPAAWPVDDAADFPEEEGEFFEPHGDWSIGGAIIERERIELHCRTDNRPFEWAALPFSDEGPERWDLMHRGPTPLVAAMRVYVASKFGAEVELP